MTQGPVASLVLEGSGESPESDTDGSIVVDIDFTLFDERIRGRILVADGPAGLADVVPPARALVDEIILRVTDRSRRDGAGVTCRKGCAACCRYLVPLSVPEIFRLWDEIESFSQQQRQQVMSACMDTSRRILNAKPAPASQTGTTRDEGTPEPASDEIGRWYAGIDVACPFLEENACTIYPLRPIACREHMAISPAECCEPANPGRTHLLEPPFSITEALGRLAAEMEETEIESIMLPLAPAWREMNRDRSVRKWPAPDLLKRFAAIVHDLAARRSGRQPAAA